MENSGYPQGTDNTNNNPPQAYPPNPAPNGAQMNSGMPPQNYPPQGYGPQQPYMAPPAPAPQGGKSSVAAGLLGIFLGWVGVHNFYLGYKQLGFIHLGLGGGGFLIMIIGTILPFIMFGSGNLSGTVSTAMLMPALVGIGSLLMAGSGIWGFVEGIMCFSKSGKYAHDANGIPLS